MPNTLYDKIWNDHLVDQQDDGTALLFVDRHLVHEVTSPQAFEGLRNSNRKVRHPKLTLAVADHNVPTTDRSKGISDKESKIQVDTLGSNCKEFGIQLFGMDDKRQGIVHIIGGNTAARFSYSPQQVLELADVTFKSQLAAFKCSAVHPALHIKYW